MRCNADRRPGSCWIALAEVGVVRGEAFLTNAVKHFKCELRGKRRIRSRQNAGDIGAGRWGGHELALVHPRLTVALGGMAAAFLASHKGPLHAVRGRITKTREGAPLFITLYPSFL